MLVFHFDTFSLILFKDHLVIYKSLDPYSFSELAFIFLNTLNSLSDCFAGLILLLFFLTLAH